MFRREHIHRQNRCRDAVDAIQVMDHMIDQMQQKIFDMTKLSDEMTEAGENAKRHYGRTGKPQ